MRPQQATSTSEGERALFAVAGPLRARSGTARRSDAGVGFAEHAGRRQFSMMDLVYLSLTAGLLALTWGLVRLCERV
jgi:hypothetical protein